MVPALNASWISKLHNRGAFADGCIWQKKPAGLKAAALMPESGTNEKVAVAAG